MTPRRWSMLAALATAAACTPGTAASPEQAPPVQHGHVVAPEAHAIVPLDSTADLREPGALRSVRAAPVVGRAGPDGRPFEVALRTPGTDRHMRAFGRTGLAIALRTGTSELTQYPCTACHMGRGTVLRDERAPDAHTNIQPTHPRETGATCATCHSSDNVELLALRAGEKVTLDHAYRVCAQCHFSQADAWAAGVHGKRLDGWQGRRVVMGCTDCHDPHEPVLQQRLPFRPPTLHRAGSRKP
jgi:hypothetical protein